MSDNNVNTDTKLEPQKPRTTGPSQVDHAKLFQPSLFRRLMESKALLGFIGILIFLAVWEVAATLEWINPIFTSQPTGWSVRLVELLANPDLGIYEHMVSTLRTLFGGFLIAVVAGIPLGIIIGWLPILDRLTSSLVAVMYGVPYIALLPVIIIWFGIGDTSRIIIVIWAALFPILINTTVGVSNVDRELIGVGRAFCASSRQIFMSIVTPASVPYVVAGLRLAIGRALVAAIVAEFFMASSGLGYFINARSNALDSDSAFGAQVLLSIVGLVLVGVVARIESHYGRCMERN